MHEKNMKKKNRKISKLSRETAQKMPKKKKSKAKTEINTLSQKAKQCRKSNFIKYLIENNFNISKACEAADVPRRTFYDWRRDDAEFKEQIDDVFEARIDAWEECLHKNIKAGSDVSVIFGLKTKGKKRGYGESSVNEEIIGILGKVLTKELSPRDAAYQISMMGEPIPEALRLELLKIQPDPPPHEIPPEIKDEDLEASYQKQLKMNNQEEKEWVPARQAEVRQLKDELKGTESFGPDAENNRKGANPS